MKAHANDRVDAWLDLAINDELEVSAADELHRLAHEDQAVAEQIRHTLLVEAVLRGRATAPDFTPQIVAALAQREKQHQAQFLTAVMAQIRARPQNATTARPRAIVAFAVAATAVFAFAAMAAVLSRQRAHHARTTALTNQTHTAPKADGRTSAPSTQMGQTGDLAGPSLTRPAPLSPLVPDVLNFDFDNGALPEVFEQGHVMVASADTSSGYVVQGTFNAWAPEVSSILINQARGLFTFHEDLVLRFKFFLAPNAKGLRVQIFDNDQRQNYRWDHPNPVRGAWTNAVVSLADFHPVKDRSRALERGDRIQNVFIMGGPINDTPLLVDDIVLSGH